MRYNYKKYCCHETDVMLVYFSLNHLSKITFLQPKMKIFNLRISYLQKLWKIFINIYGYLCITIQGESVQVVKPTFSVLFCFSDFRSKCLTSWTSAFRQEIVGQSAHLFLIHNFMFDEELESSFYKLYWCPPAFLSSMYLTRKFSTEICLYFFTLPSLW